MEINQNKLQRQKYYLLYYLDGNNQHQSLEPASKVFLRDSDNLTCLMCLIIYETLIAVSWNSVIFYKLFFHKMSLSHCHHRTYLMTICRWQTGRYRGKIRYCWYGISVSSATAHCFSIQERSRRWTAIDDFCPNRIHKIMISLHVYFYKQLSIIPPHLCPSLPFVRFSRNPRRDVW